MIKKAILILSVLFLVQGAFAEQICTIRTRVYVPKTLVNKYITAKITTEVKDWQDCYARALQETREFKAHSVAHVQVNIFNKTISESDHEIYLLTDWKVSTHWYGEKIKGTVNEFSASEPAIGFQGLDFAQRSQD